MMFNIREALRELNGKTLDYSELRSRLEKIRFANLELIPAEFTATDIFLLAKREHCVKEEADGRITVKS